MSRRRAGSMLRPQWPISVPFTAELIDALADDPKFPEV
jgi:hypothetical protein